jgi:hypothetical protein
MIAALKSLVPTIEAWPDEDQARLVDTARMIEAERLGTYHASAEELIGIDRGLADAGQGRFASDEKLAAVRFVPYWMKLRYTDAALVSPMEFSPVLPCKTQIPSCRGARPLASLETRTMVMQVSRMPGRNARATCVSRGSLRSHLDMRRWVDGVDAIDMASP